MATDNKGGPQAQAAARTIFPNTGGTIIGGIGGMVQTGPVQVIEHPPRPPRVLPLDVISARFEALALDNFTKRLGAEKVDKMRAGQAANVVAFKAAHAPDDDRAVPVAARATLPAKMTASKKK